MSSDKIVPLTPENSPPDEAPMSIPKPSKSQLDMFKSTRDPSIAGVETLLTALPHHNMSEAKDWVRLHPDEENYWSPELCFVHRADQRAKTRPAASDQRRSGQALPRQRSDPALSLGAGDQSRTTSSFSVTCRRRTSTTPGTTPACGLACRPRAKWAQATSRKGENAEGYQITYAKDQDSFPEPNWPKQTLDELILVTFNGRMIDQRRSSRPAAADRREAVAVMTENFSSVVVCDFEYEVTPGDLPDVLCMVAYVLDENLRHVRTIRLWRGEFGPMPPFDIGPDTLFVAYSAWAEMTCFKVLGWQFPVHIFDQHTAYLAASNDSAALRTRRNAEEAAQAAVGRLPRPWHRRLGAHRQGNHRQSDRRRHLARTLQSAGSCRLLRRRRAHVGEAVARATAQQPRCRCRPRAALVELQRQGDRPHPGARHADRSWRCGIWCRRTRRPSSPN